MGIIETHNICFTYDSAKKPSLDDVCIDIKKGVKTVILGSNGAGKSTMFYQFNGILRPQKGEVCVMGEPISYQYVTALELTKNLTPYIWKNGSALGGDKFKSYDFQNQEGVFNASDYRITLDEPEDFEVLKSLIHALGTDKYWKEYIDYLLEHPEIKRMNSKFGYNEGYDKSLRNDKTIK